MRIRFKGVTSLSGKLAAYPEQFEQDIKALGAEVAGDELWIQRVENGTAGKLNLDSVLAEDGALGKLLQEILATPENPEDIVGLQDVIAELRQKVPAEVFDTDSDLNLDEKKTVERLVAEAKEMLVGRLLTVEGAK
jgi:hypothetical protein